MQKKIRLGSEFFSEIIEKNGYYVDKTELIYELAEETSNKVTLFTRPRRFGKTLAMSMIESFFNIQRAGSSVFSGLDILNNHPEFCQKRMHQYPVLMMSFKDVEGTSFDGVYAMLQGVISELCIKHAFLETDSRVDLADAEVFHKLKFKETCVSKEEKEKRLEEIKRSLKTIMRMMYAVYGKPVILLIDEYDVPLAKASENHYYSQMLKVIRGIMSTSLKTNEYLEFAVVTGCLRIPEESMFTGVNNFASYSVLDEDFSGYFGFTQAETDDLLKYYDLEDKAEVIREWYDGYLFGNTEIYCPWDVMSYVSALRKRRNAIPQSYWGNTSGNGVIKRFLELTDDSVSRRFETLLNGGSITESVTNALTYEEAYTSVENLWLILLMTGYVTTVRQDGSQEEGFRSTDLRIPNKEIAKLFQKMVDEHFKKTVDPGKIVELTQALWDGDEQRASEILSEMLFTTISYNDYHEDYYHAFIAGVFTGRGYQVQYDKERSPGRQDVDWMDVSNRRRMIIEWKKSETEKRLDYWCDSGTNQIIRERYAEEPDRVGAKSNSLVLIEYTKALKYKHILSFTNPRKSEIGIGFFDTKHRTII